MRSGHGSGTVRLAAVDIANHRPGKILAVDEGGHLGEVHPWASSAGMTQARRIHPTVGSETSTPRLHRPL